MMPKRINLLFHDDGVIEIALNNDQTLASFKTVLEAIDATYHYMNMLHKLVKSDADAR